MIKSLTSPYLRIDYLTDAGPRLTGLYLAGDDTNLFADLPEGGWDTPYGKFLVRGGHRLWHSPEVKRRTYVPDNDPVTVEEFPGGVRLIQPTEPPTGISKTIEVRMLPDRPAVEVCHTLRNDNLWSVELAPWAITQMRLGGTAFCPQPLEPADLDRLLPNRNLVLWSYSSWTDQRLALGDELIMLEGSPALPPFKLGYANFDGWLAYLYRDILFVKTFPPFDPALPYPDYGCNAESYVNDQFLEVESLGPLCLLEPGESVEHLETWFAAKLEETSIEGVRDTVRKIISED